MLIDNPWIVNGKSPGSWLAWWWHKKFNSSATSARSLFLPSFHPVGPEWRWLPCPLTFPKSPLWALFSPVLLNGRFYSIYVTHTLNNCPVQWTPRWIPGPCMPTLLLWSGPSLRPQLVDRFWSNTFALSLFTSAKYIWFCCLWDPAASLLASFSCLKFNTAIPSA